MRTASLLLCFAACLAACTGGGDRYDRNDSAPKGDPDFPPLETSWVIDRAAVLSDSTIASGDATLERLKAEGIAEVVVVLIPGVAHPEEWATHYGRRLGLGRKGFAAEGGNRGLVWLVRPDARDKLTVSVGRGLPRFSSADYGPIVDEAVEYFNFGNFDKGVSVLVAGTDEVLRKIYGGSE
ncbi:MAG: TPM domain-containing protein [Candidatus Latescibacterota bacterium]|jgi:uncharacterized membrane protein YgcG|nr:MAG: TPM domain-containing protein [Candidatus Latescibacterota bacterium]